MSLARIVTRFPETTLAASEYLRSQGYTVEIVSPGDFRVTPAALELRLEKCTAEEALRRAEEAFEGHIANTAPEWANSQAEEEPRTAIAYDITGRPVEFAIVPERRKSHSSFKGALLSVLDRAWNGADSAVTGALRSLAARLHRSHTHSAVALSIDEGANSPEPQFEILAEIPTSTMDPERLAAEQEAFERERLAHLAAPEAEERQRYRMQREAEAAAEREPAERQTELTRSREQQPLALVRGEEEGERAQAAAKGDAEAERERQPAMQQQSEERERERVAAMHEAMIAAEWERTEGERVDRERQRLAAESQVREHAGRAAKPQARDAADREPVGRSEVSTAKGETSAFATAALYREPLPNAGPHPWERRLFPIGDGEWKKAFAAAGALAILIAAGMIAYANRRPAAPLTPNELRNMQSVEQQKPFASATIAPSTTAKPSPAVVPAIQKPAPAVRHFTQRSSAARPPASHRTARHLQRSPAQTDDLAEDEIVVRHFRETKPVRKQHASAGLKHYSDMN